MKEKNRVTKVSVIESDVLMRQILSSMLRIETGIQLTGSVGFSTVDNHLTAIALQKPHLVMIGIESPDSEINHLFEEVLKKFPDIYVVLMTPLNAEGAGIAINGLKKGAIEYITKPDKRNGMVLAINHFHKRVLPLLKAVPRLNRNKPAVSAPAKITTNLNKSAEKSYTTRRSTDLIVIGSCLGGVTSIYKIMAALPESLPVPVIIVQHMPKIYTGRLAEDLDKITNLTVIEAHDNSMLIPGQVYVAPGGFHSVVKANGSRKYLIQHRGPREHRCRPSIDVLLRSAVQSYGSKILGVFLSGGGNDGIQGASYLLGTGGKVMVESRESSLLWDLPGTVQMLSSEIMAYPADNLGTEITKLLKAELQEKLTRTVRKDLPAADWMVESFEK